MNIHEHAKLTECAALEDISVTLGLGHGWENEIDWYCRAAIELVLLC
jgi:hypothetical protein